MFCIVSWRFNVISIFCHFLAVRTAARIMIWSAIVMILSSVCLSVRPSVTLCVAVVGVVVGGWKLYRRIPRRALPIHFFRHYCCRMYPLAIKTQWTAKNLTGINSRLPISKADFRLKLQTSKYSWWPRLSQPTVCIPVRSAITATAELLVFYLD